MTIAVPQRVQKVLAQRGVGSRREIETWISAGLVKVNGKVAELGTKVTDQDQISVNGKIIPPVEEDHRVILYNKPIGEICTRSDPQGRSTVFAALPKLMEQRWISVGRLDINSSGLIIFTTDGELANQLMHPKANIEREYAVRVLGGVTERILRKITTGVIFDDGTKAKFTHVKSVGGSGANVWYHVTLTQGRYREVRRIWESQGLRVSRLMRIRYGSFKLPRDLREGNYIELDYAQVKRQFKV